MELPPESPIYAVCRLRVVDDAPLSVQTNFLPAALCPKLEEADLTSSLYRLLESRYGLRLWTGRESLRARGATLHEAQLLGIREGTPVMYAERTTYAVSGTPGRVPGGGLARGSV